MASTMSCAAAGLFSGSYEMISIGFLPLTPQTAPPAPSACFQCEINRSPSLASTTSAPAISALGAVPRSESLDFALNAGGKTSSVQGAFRCLRLERGSSPDRAESTHVRPIPPAAMSSMVYGYRSGGWSTSVARVLRGYGKRERAKWA